MSKQGPREAGMCTFASAAGHRHATGEINKTSKEVAA